MYIIKDENDNITDSYMYLGLRHVINPDIGSEDINITIGYKNNSNSNSYWILNRLNLTDEELSQIMHYTPESPTSIRELISSNIYRLAKEKGIIPIEAINYDPVFQ